VRAVLVRDPHVGLLHLARNDEPVIDGGKQDKLRPGDLLGALTQEIGLAGTDVGTIDVHPTRTYVAIRKAQAETAVVGLRKGKIKGRSFKVRRLGSS
jgi:ATP-dependent RNA helicase DbpA